VVERINGKRVFREYPIEHILYYPDHKGSYTTIFGTRVSKFSTKSVKEFRRELAIHEGKQLFESDFNPIFRCLENNYRGKDSPELQTAFFDIEVDFDKDKGFSPTSDPFNPVTAVSVYLSWLGRMVTLVIPPKTLSVPAAEDIANLFEDTIVFEKEKDLLNAFLDLIDDADVLSGWNSEGYDIPYLVNRITRVLSKNDTRRFCLWDKLPKLRTFERFGAEQFTFDTVGRVHMDYMQLYRKYTYEERHSYSLDAIGEHELNERKVAYEGTLDQLYNQDFRKFIEYNRQDTLLLHKLDQKLKFIDLANAIAHDNTVLLPTVMGAVAVTDQAVINEAHSRGLVVPSRDRNKNSDDNQAAGAYVAVPKKGIHEWIGSVDINSLYPSAIRALNMGPETIVGQLRPTMTDEYIKQRMDEERCTFAAAWEGVFATLEYTAVKERRGTKITVDWQNGKSEQFTAEQIWNMIFSGKNPWVLTANGTIFTYERKGIIPSLLENWYATRKQQQKTLRSFIEVVNGVELPSDLADKLKD
jgi:DNA polymerase elongation subunit (family B)